MPRATALLTALALAGAGAAWAGSDRDRRLAAGEVLTTFSMVAGSDVAKARALGVVDAPPEKVWAVVSDCARFAGTLPNVDKSELVRRKGSHFFCRVTIGLPFPMDDLWSVTDAVHVVGPPRWSRSWEHVEGTYKVNRGAWVLTPFGADGKRTLVDYWIHAEPDTSIPGFVQRFAQERSLPGVIESVRKAVKKR